MNATTFSNFREWSARGGVRIPILLAAIAALMPVPATAQSPATAFVESRADGQTRNLSGYQVVTTGGFHAAGDGGNALFRNAGTGTATDGASFNDSAGTLWQYVPGPAGIHVRQFGAKCDWNLNQDGNRNYAAYDLAANDDAQPFRQALAFAATTFADGDDKGGGRGQTVHAPKGSCKIGSMVRVPDQVVLSGEGPLSTVLVMPQNFSQSAHFIELGNDNNLASFGSRVEELQLWSVNSNADLGRAMLYSDNTQHTGGAYRVKIFAGNRSAIWLEGGYGGASYVTLEQLDLFNFGDRTPGPEGTTPNSVNPIIYLGYVGSSIMSVRDVALHGPRANAEAYTSNAMGIYVAGGQVEIDGFHVEGVANGIWIATPANYPGGAGMTRLRNLTGGEGCTNLVQLASNVEVGTTVIGMAIRNGCSVATVADGHSGASPTTSRIVADTVF
jgi:hypothetical protein